MELNFARALKWGGLIAVVALALLVAPILAPGILLVAGITAAIWWLGWDDAIWAWAKTGARILVGIPIALFFWITGILYLVIWKPLAYFDIWRADEGVEQGYEAIDRGTAWVTPNAA